MNFSEYLRDSASKGNVILYDGALGTELLNLVSGFSPSPPTVDHYNLRNPFLVRKVHDQYIDAGADIIKTNTFLSHRFGQASEKDFSDELLSSGAYIARRAADEADRKIWVAGSLGPTVRSTFDEELKLSYHKSALALIPNVDLLLLETQMDVAQTRLAVEGIRSAALLLKTPLLLHLSFSVPVSEGTPNTRRFPLYLPLIEELKPNILGVNCIPLPFSRAPFFYGLGDLDKSLPIALQPNAGYPAWATPMTFSNYLVDVARENNISLIGGCCGTTPLHIHFLRKALSYAASAA